jgi:DNA anti-recombination protein RmuC
MFLATHHLSLVTAMLAQASLESIPDSWLKQMAVFILVAITAASFAAAALFSGLQYFLDRRNAVRQQERKNPPAAQRLATDEMCLQRHAENRTRIEKAEEDIRALRAEMHSEDRAIRQDLAEKFSSIQRLLGRIEEKIDSK